MKDDSLMLRQWQRQWIAQLQNVDALVAVTTEETLTENHQSPFFIYQHNMQQRLTESLAFIYPALLTAMGDAAFTELVIAFIAVDLPTDPDLMRYGEGLASFLVNQNVTRHGYADIARLEWFLHESALAHQHPLLICESDASVSLGIMSGHALFLERHPRILRTTTTTMTQVAPHHDVDLPSLNGSTCNASALFGICAMACPGGLGHLALSAGEYAFIRFLTHDGKTLEEALLWGLYSQPDGRFGLILEQLQSGGYLRIQ